MPVDNRRRLVLLTVKKAEVHGTCRRALKANTQRNLETRMVAVGDSDALRTDAYIAEQTNLTNTQPEGEALSHSLPPPGLASGKSPGHFKSTQNILS